MTVETILRFTPDLDGALEASIEAVQTAVMRAPDGSQQEGRLETILAELRAIRQSTKPTFSAKNFAS